jgi:hypothetical protein
VKSNDGEVEDEVEIDHLIVELPEGDDPLAGQAIAQEMVPQLLRLLES